MSNNRTTTTSKQQETVFGFSLLSTFDQWQAMVSQGTWECLVESSGLSECLCLNIRSLHSSRPRCQSKWRGNDRVNTSSGQSKSCWSKLFQTLMLMSLLSLLCYPSCRSCVFSKRNRPSSSHQVCSILSSSIHSHQVYSLIKSSDQFALFNVTVFSFLCYLFRLLSKWMRWEEKMTRKSCVFPSSI